MTFVWVKFAIEGFHKYPDAPEEVAYLRDRHRHMFHYKVSIQVRHDDREIEFHLFKTWLLALFADKVLEANNKSCEMLAKEIRYQIRQHPLYGATLPPEKVRERRLRVEVSEDGECGATIAD